MFFTVFLPQSSDAIGMIKENILNSNG